MAAPRTGMGVVSITMGSWPLMGAMILRITNMKPKNHSPNTTTFFVRRMLTFRKPLFIFNHRPLTETRDGRKVPGVHFDASRSLGPVEELVGRVPALFWQTQAKHLDRYVEVFFYGKKRPN